MCLHRRKPRILPNTNVSRAEVGYIILIKDSRIKIYTIYIESNDYSKVIIDGKQFLREAAMRDGFIGNLC